MLTAGVAGCGDYAGEGVISRGFIRPAGAVPRCGGVRGSRSRAGTVQVPPGEGLSAVAAAFVQVGGEPGEGVQPGHLAVAVTVKIRAAFRAVFPLWEPPAFFLVTTGPLIVLSAVLLSSYTIG